MSLTVEQEVWVRAWCAQLRRHPSYAPIPPSPSEVAARAVEQFRERFPQPESDNDTERYARIGRKCVTAYDSCKNDADLVAEICAIMEEETHANDK